MYIPAEATDGRTQILLFSDFGPQNCLHHSSNYIYLQLPLKSLMTSAFLLWLGL